MTRAKNKPNTQLRALLEESRWTNHNLAYAVNRVGAESGVALHYDRTTVSHWLSGSRPRRPVPAFAAEAFTRRLGRTVTITETGLADSTLADSALVDPALVDSSLAGSPLADSAGHAPATPDEDRSAVMELLDLVTADLRPGSHRFLTDAPYRVDWALPADRPNRTIPPANGPGGRLAPGRSEVDAVKLMTLRFAEADNAFGGGHARLALITYLATDVAGWLRARANDQVRREMLSATARLTHLVGFMCFDNLHHHLAQRYYRAALRLFSEANDSVGHAVVLRAMSMQAWFLGHRRQAVKLADEAILRVNALPPSRTSAALLGQAAVAHAAVSEARKALDLLARAEQHLDTTGSPAPAGSAERADVAHQIGETLALLRDDGAAERALRESLRHRAQAERRPRMLTTHQLAAVQLRSGRIEQACETWQSFLAEYPGICSGRVGIALGQLHRQLTPYSANRAVRQVLDQAGQLIRLRSHF